MPDTPIFSTNSIDVAAWLKSRTLMGDFRGREIWNRLQEEVQNLSGYRALIIDTTQALFLDYDFSSNAFAPLFADDELCDQQRFVMFQIARSDLNAFFHGVLKYLKVSVGEYAKSRETFVALDHVCKIIESSSGPVEFVGHLEVLENEILQAVNEQQHADLQKLAEAVGQPAEEVHDALRVLVTKGAVIDVGQDGHEYYSFNRFLSKD